MRSLKDLNTMDKFCLFNGMEVLSAASGVARTRLVVKPHHLNGLGIVHGGAVFTLGDLAFAAAANCGADAVVSTNTTISFVKAAGEGELLAEAREIARSKKLVTYEIRVSSAAGDLVAVMLGTGYIRGKPAQVDQQ
ncbi:MAG: PaaI family thioesterase [Candidatus Omnitrophica bacterium]|nr:PaaI family thioesterase [Candidatus Omnitrophota bacterium]